MRGAGCRVVAHHSLYNKPPAVRERLMCSVLVLASCHLLTTFGLWYSCVTPSIMEMEVVDIVDLISNVSIFPINLEVCDTVIMSVAGNHRLLAVACFALFLSLKAPTH